MKNILIVSKNLEFCRELNNNMGSNVRISYISTSYDEALDNVKSSKPDIVIFELEIKYYMIINLIEEIKKLELYSPVIMVITRFNLYDIKEKYSKCIVINEKSNDFLKLYKVLKYIEKLKEPPISLDDKILKEMHSIGFEMKNKGDQMIFKVVKYIKTHEDVGTNLEKEIYHSLSKNIGVSEKQIKWNINYSINSIYETKNEKVCNYLNIGKYEKPTSKYIIYAISNNV